MEAEAAVSKGKDKQLEAAVANQGGGVVISAQFRQQVAIGEATAGHRITTSRFRITPGFFGATLSGPRTGPPVSDLDLGGLHAKTDPVGLEIAPQAWQKDNDPIFIWEPPAAGPDVAGYSYAIDSTPDDVVDTTATSFNVATSPPKTLTDGKHTFAVKAINTAGNAGKPLSLELWIDTIAPQIVASTPAAGALLNTPTPPISVTVSDVGSGVNETGATVLINGSSALIRFEQATGVLTATGGAWKEGANSLELRIADGVGNAQAPLVWSVRIDTKPPTGTITINAGAAMTTSVHVTLGLSASDTTSGVARLLLSNEELTGYVEEPYVALRELWRLTPIRGIRTVYAKFIDEAGNISEPVSDEIDLGLLSPETVITSGPAGFTQNRDASFAFMCPEGDCLFSFAFDNDEWSEWSPAALTTKADLTFGNHYFRVKAAKDVNGTAGIQPDEEDPSPAERTWVVGVETPVFSMPGGPAIKVWRLE
jgi:hypothetical protein